MQLIMRINNSLSDIFTLAMTSIQMFGFFEDYCKSLPELLLELTKKIISEGETVPNGYFNFKRVQKDRIIVY